MESREEVLAAENSRLQAEMSSMKKKIMHALKKQQAELQAKIQAAEQRAAAAEAAIISSSPVSQSVSETSDTEVASSLRSDGTLPGYSNGEARDEQELIAELSKLRAELEDERQGRSKDQEEIIKERDQLQEDLKQLRGLLETECNQKLALEQRLQRELEEAKLEDEKRIEQLSKANQNMEAQLMAAAQQVSDAFTQIAGMHDKLENVSKESHTVNLAYATLTKEHERICKELEKANDDSVIKAHEMEEMLASHKATQEGQEAAMSQLMQQLQTMEASLAVQTQKDELVQMDVGSTEGKEILLEQVQERNRTVEALRKELAELRNRDFFMNGESSPILEDLKQQNEVLTAKMSTLKEVNETLQRKIQEIPSSELQDRSSGASSAFLNEIASLKEQLKESRDRASNLEKELDALSEENANVTRKLEIETKERDGKYTELDLKFSRLQKRAKQRIQEVQKEKDEIEAKLSSAQEKEAQAISKQANLQNELERFRAQAGDAIRALDAERQNLRSANLKLKEEVDDLKRLLDAKEHSLAESRRLASEKDQAALSMHAEMKEAEERHAAALSDLNEKNNKVVEGLQNQLAEATLETNKLAETISALQAELADKESKLVDVEAALTGEVARLSATVEAAKGETAQVNEEQKNERLQWRATVVSLETKIQQLEIACQQTELASSEAKRQWGTELETQRQAVADAQRETSLAKDEVARLSKEFTAYKVRAHALLQKKESEIHAAKDADLAAAQEAHLKDAQKEAAAAAAERDRAVNALKQAATEYETQLAARNVAIIDAEQRIRELATKLESMKGLLAFEREEWQRHSQELDVSWREKYEELARKQAHPADESIKSELSAMRSDFERLKGDYDSFRDMANKMMEAKDQEIAKLLDDNNSLLKSVQSQSQVSSQPSSIQPALDQQDASISILAVAEQQILLLARQQAQREEELKQCQRQIQVLQEELSELEHENRLHGQQEAMLKEELRSMERAAKRNGVDMTYLKNVILKLLETGEAEALLPVVGMLLQFSPDEVRRCQEAYSAAAAADSAASTPRSLLSRLSFSSGK